MLIAHQENHQQRTTSNSLGWLIPSVLFLGSLLLIVITSKDYGVTWDEPPYFHASDLHVRWISGFTDNLAKGEIGKSLDDETIKAAWRWNPYNVPHPPFSRVVSGLAKTVSSPFLDKFTAYRLGPALFFALLVTASFLWMRELCGTSTGLFSAIAIILTPNLYGFAHIAVTDLPLASMWFLTAYSFWKGISSWKWSIFLGVIWGLAISTKFPAVLILVPLILWAQLFHRNKYANNIFCMLFVAPVVMVATQPYLWHQTGLRVLEFLYEGISRGYRPETNFGVLFFGEILTSNQLPWYYTFLTVGITTPEPFILLTLLGSVSIVWAKDQRAVVMLFVLNLLFILLLGLMPGAVLHDGVRQLLSALPFLVALAGVGFHSLLYWTITYMRQLRTLSRVAHLEKKVACSLLVLVCFGALLDTYLSHPFQLSFYNRFVGGVRGAYERGLETTYFMEAFTPSFLRTLNEELPENATINASVANFMFDFYQKEGRLRPDIKITAGPSFDYYILLNRRTTIGSKEQSLINSPTKPFLAVDLAGVPLVSVFEFKTATTLLR